MDTEEGDTASVLGKSCRKTLHSGYWVKIIRIRQEKRKPAVLHRKSHMRMIVIL
jgi:hypothetical protein